MVIFDLRYEVTCAISHIRIVRERYPWNVRVHIIEVIERDQRADRSRITELKESRQKDPKPRPAALTTGHDRNVAPEQVPIFISAAYPPLKRAASVVWKEKESADHQLATELLVE